MTSLTGLREVVDVVIGVDTHVPTHSAAVLDTATGGVLDEIRQALSVLLVARRSAINTSTEAQQQVFSLGHRRTRPIRGRFRGQKLAAMLNNATSREVKRCLARYVARDLYRPLESGPAAAVRRIGASRLHQGRDRG